MDKISVDEQTGQVYTQAPEKFWDTLAAWFCGLYLLFSLGFLSWMLFDFWLGESTILDWLGYEGDRLDSALFSLFAYTVLGGGLGGSISGLRGLINFHSEQGSFGRRFIWKYLSLPWLGAVLALLIYVLLRTGIGALSGGVTVDGNSLSTFSAFGIGGLAGYGSHQVFVWLDARVNRIFRVESGATVPGVKGRGVDEAAAILRGRGLAIGRITEEESDDASGTILAQSPPAGAAVTGDRTIDIVVPKTAENS